MEFRIRIEGHALPCSQPRPRLCFHDYEDACKDHCSRRGERSRSGRFLAVFYQHPAPSLLQQQFLRHVQVQGQQSSRCFEGCGLRRECLDRETAEGRIQFRRQDAQGGRRGVGWIPQGWVLRRRGHLVCHWLTLPGRTHRTSARGKVPGPRRARQAGPGCRLIPAPFHFIFPGLDPAALFRRLKNHEGPVL